MADDPAGVLDFWLREVGPARWYAGDAALDADIAERFGDLWRAARDGGLAHWVEGPAGSLALAVLTDQVPRNMFRGTAQAFATDALARDACDRAIAAGWDMEVPEPERQFFYLPYEHSEAPADQDRAVDLIATRMTGEAGAEAHLHARAHREVIARFGRFPFRNAALGRRDTDEEARFLAAGAYGAVVRALRGEAPPA